MNDAQFHHHYHLGFIGKKVDLHDVYLSPHFIANDYFIKILFNLFCYLKFLKDFIDLSLSKCS